MAVEPIGSDRYVPIGSKLTESEDGTMNGISVRRRGFAIMALSLAVPMAGVALGSPAGAVGTTGSATGTVVNAATSKPMKNMCVNVVEASTNTTVGTSGPSTSHGVWTLAGIPPAADYTAIAFDCTKGNHVPQWYNGQDFQSSATQFAVGAGITTSGIDFSLSQGGAITGKVTDAVTKKPVAGILVIAYWNTAVQVAGAACTTANGKYKISGIATTGTRVEFVPGACGPASTYTTTWYGGVNYASASVIAIMANKTTSNINQAMS